MNQPELYAKNNAVEIVENLHVWNKYSDLMTWKNEGTILEIGIGDGKYTLEELLPRLTNVKRYVAIDISEEMLKYTKETYGSDKYPLIELRKLDCQTDILPADLISVFDHAVSFNCFHWFTNVRQALDNIFKMLKPGGTIMASFSERSPVDDIFHSMSKHPVWGSYGHGNFVGNFFPTRDAGKEWKNAFSLSGFVDIKEFIEERIVSFASEKLFIDLYKSVDPIAAKIPNGRIEAYLSDYLEEVEKGNANTIKIDEKTGERKCIMKYNLVTIIARKP